MNMKTLCMVLAVILLATLAGIEMTALGERNRAWDDRNRELEAKEKQVEENGRRAMALIKQAENVLATAAQRDAELKQRLEAEYAARLKSEIDKIQPVKPPSQ